MQCAAARKTEGTLHCRVTQLERELHVVRDTASSLEDMLQLATESLQTERAEYEEKVNRLEEILR